MLNGDIDLIFISKDWEKLVAGVKKILLQSVKEQVINIHIGVYLWKETTATADGNRELIAASRRVTWIYNRGVRSVRMEFAGRALDHIAPSLNPFSRMQRTAAQVTDRNMCTIIRKH